MNNQIVTRFAPSPTGFLQCGNYRTAVYSYLFARKNKGKFLLRIEDTDRERSKDEYTENILDSLAWLGLDFDNKEEIVYQSKRTEIYKKYLQKLIDEDKAYLSKEEIKKEGDRSEVIRFRNPGKKVTFHDLIRGDITTDTTELGDFIIAKSLDEPVFHLTVVIDDFEMGITHVVRGEDHIPNTPRHILIQEAIGAPMPQYAHLPLVLAPDRTKLSKRKGALAVTEYRSRGYLPQAMLNFIAFLGWNPGTTQEFFSKDELIDLFDLSKVQKGGAIFNDEKLNWFNREHIKQLTPEELSKEVKKWVPKRLEELTQYSKERFAKLEPVLIERVQNFGELKNLLEEGEYDYFFDTPKYDIALLKTTEYLAETIKIVEKVSDDNFTADNIKNSIWDFATEKGRGQVLWPMRAALTGREKSPDPFLVASILGKEETITRLRYATQTN